ncbi:hypothetical protein [Pleurocapsa sp. FMAR1]|nr:hypothetical protein [Pleurocapsa sp. FMAR1]
MKTATATQIKHVENTLEVLNQFGIEIELDNILAKELERGLSSDISNCY